MDDLQGRVTLKYRDTVRGPWQIPRWEVLSVGRTHGYGLHLPNSWVPSKLCRFLPWEQGWVVQVGPRPRMRVQDPYVGDHTFDRAALVALQEGECLLSFPELDDFVQLGVVIGPDAAGGLPLAEDDELVRGIAIPMFQVALRQHVFLLRFQHRKAADLLEIPSEAAIA